MRDSRTDEQDTSAEIAPPSQKSTPSNASAKLERRRRIEELNEKKQLRDDILDY